MLSLRSFFPAVILSSLALGATPATAADLQLGEALGVAVRPTVLRGYNFGNWMQVAEFGDPLRELAPALLRFPAGNIGDEFDLSETSLTLAKAGASLLGQPPLLVQTRVFQGKSGEPVHNRPEDAAQAVRISATLGLAVPYWEIGNEPDLYAVTRGDPSWTADRYCAVFRAQAAAIRAVAPQARIAGPAVSGSLPARDDFIERFVRGCGDVLDVLTWHIYPSEGEKSDEAALATASEASRTLTQMRALWADPHRNPLGHQRAIGFGVTEYGLSWRTERPRHIADQVAALWAAETALRLNEGGAEMAQYFALQGTGGHGLLDLAGAARPSWYAFRLLAALRGDFLAVRSSKRALWLHATRDGNTLQLLVTNPTAEALTLQSALPGYRLEHQRGFDAALAEAEEAMVEQQGHEKIVLPPRSMTLLSYSRSER
ncbi:GH39 family glycosyl hydrolase [Niveibacterium terrae]|uniref:GH39 family glycosyl hydrolase n=1 Tax=Niveibacterium terrae TaxID=3373598 RepID=UPI003A94E790